MSKNIVLDFLFEHASAEKLPREWEKLLHVKIVDEDGWRNKKAKSMNEPVGLVEFIERLRSSTICYSL